MNQIIKKIINKLSQEDKTELKSEKIELALVNDLEKEIERIEYKQGILKGLIKNYKSQADNFKSRWYSEFRGIALDVEESSQSARKQTEKITQSAKELGLDAGDIVKKYQRASTIANKTAELADRYLRAISKL
jgi:hypothetical protein